MKHNALLKHSAALLASILNGRSAADKAMERYFRENRELGVRDRGAVAETVYACLRRLAMLRHAAGPDAPATALVAVQLLTQQGWSARALEQAGYPERPGFEGRVLAERSRSLGAPDLPLEVRTNLPEWLAQRLVAQLGEEETLRLAEALNQPATLDLRVNTVKADRATVQAQLAEEGHVLEPTPYSPLGLRRADRAPLFKSPSFQAGLFEIQDEGSQLLGLLLEPKRREMVVDFCAGAGGKTLELGALMVNSGTLYAFDIVAKRLEKLKPRLARAGLDNVRSVVIGHERDERVRRLAGKADRVLVDAPCSGSGTVRRNPDIKWRPLNLDEITATQQRILEAAATLVKPGGRLVYATCSLLREENEDIVNAFLAAHDTFHLVPVGEVLARRNIPLPDMGEMLRLYPHRHNTDGFFAAVLERKPL
ncbi:MAG: SAM-dependent methyltransferase [Gammaproteobacteria bacterium HGW-Gammaproteobacteria-1]|jgi:16S rRNA (cytosine967-C5)-methyltransferase|nr:MAG: SAM-dependent methyltransferase [Gammaproteobacteria bacterium HGW-Gammaproteobacteria-1]